MKITEMLQREDFYKINKKTLRRYYGNASGSSTKLYIYPRLNAIVTSSPSKKVISYLNTEYSVRSLVKRIVALGYVNACMVSKGLLADKAITIHNNLSNDILIYPCNKKYRVFDFYKETVSVIIKDGFDNSDLLHEIEFRKQQDNPEFIPRLLLCSAEGYTEKIINGVPLARITDNKKYNIIKKRAYKLFKDYYSKDDRVISTKDYIEKTIRAIDKLLKKKANNYDEVKQVVSLLQNRIDLSGNIKLCFSHGDFQAGNIWIDNNDHIFIIDWESWGERSVWYDHATLFNSLRPGDISGFLNSSINTQEKATVLLEDIVFQLKELNSLPYDFGIEGFNNYIQKVGEWLRRN